MKHTPTFHRLTTAAAITKHSDVGSEHFANKNIKHNKKKDLKKKKENNNRQYLIESTFNYDEYWNKNNKNKQKTKEKKQTNKKKNKQTNMKQSSYTPSTL